MSLENQSSGAHPSSNDMMNVLIGTILMNAQLNVAEVYLSPIRKKY